MHIKKQLVIPDELRDVIPNSWTKPLDFVTKKEAINIIYNYVNFNYENDETLLVVKYDPVEMSGFNVKSIVASTTVLKPKTDADLQLSENYNSFLLNIVNIRERFNKWRSNVIPIQADSSKKEINSSNSDLQKKGIENPVSNPLKNGTIEVQPGDTIQKIAKRHYGKSSKWQFIVEKNNLEVKTVTINGQIISLFILFQGSV